MRACIAMVMVVTLVAGTASLAGAQSPADERRVLRDRLEERYDLVPLSDGLALRPKSRSRDVRLIEITEGAVVVNGVAATGRELRDRLGSDADAVLRLSYLSTQELRELVSARPQPGRAAAPDPEPPLERVEPAPSEPRPSSRPRRSSGDRIRIFGDVSVDKDEEITGQVVAVFGSARVHGEVGDQVVAVFGSVLLGPEAVVGGDVVSVGGRVFRADGSQTRRGVTEVSLQDASFPFPVQIGRWHGWEGAPFFLTFGAVPKLFATALRLTLLLLLTGIALLVARGSVEASAERIRDHPLKVTIVGLVAEVLALPALVLTVIVLSVSIIGIPLLLLMPFVVLALLVMALVGFTGAAVAVGQFAQRRFGPGVRTDYLAVLAGVLVILSPVLLARLLGLAGWPLTPVAVVLVAVGFTVELLAWACGFGAVLSNAFTRWQARTQIPNP